MKLIAIIIFCLLCSSCKREEKYKDQEKLCHLVLEIYKDDQKYRSLMVDPFFKILDSIKKSEGIKEVYNSFSEKKQLAYGKRARKIANKRKNKFTKVQEDSLMQLQKLLDNKNTELLIEIIKERGFPNLPNCKGDKFPTITLRHSQSQYWDELRPLLEKEYKKGNMDKAQYKFVLNHINGREEFDITEDKVNKLAL